MIFPLFIAVSPVTRNQRAPEQCPQQRKDFHIFIGGGPQEKTWDRPGHASA
jgi:hypothetical protein